MRIVGGLSKVLLQSCSGEQRAGRWTASHRGVADEPNDVLLKARELLQGEAA